MVTRCVRKSEGPQHVTKLDCGALGLRCASEQDGPKCATQGAACTEGALRCEGGVAIQCWHGHEVRVDCLGAGLACNADAGATGAAVGACRRAAPRENACDPSSAPKCDGSTLRWCAWGTPRAYLCRSMGLGRCVTDERGSRCSD